MDRKVFRDGFLKSKIDEYKYGTISAEEFCHAMTAILTGSQMK